MFTADELLTLVEAIYAGILDPIAWSSALERICRAFGEEAVLLAMADHGKRLIDNTVHVDAGDRYHDSCVALMEAQAMDEFCAGYGEHKLDALRLLRPHLLRAWQTRLRLNEAADATAGAYAALDQVAQGAVLVDAQSAVVHTNRAAEAVLSRNDGLFMPRSVLACDHADDTVALRRLVADTSSVPTCRPSGTLAVRRRSGRRPLSVLVASLRDSRWAPPGRGATAMVLVADPETAIPATVADALRVAYDLTAAEARTATALLDHGHLAAVARTLGVSLATVRTLLQRTFDKTGTHSQAELVRLMLAHRLPAAPTAVG